MRVHLEISGGFGGLFAVRPLAAEAADADLTDQERASLTGLTSGARSGVGPLGGTAPDAHTYRLTIATSGGRRTVTYDDVTLPSELRPLVERLRKRAMEARGGSN